MTKRTAIGLPPELARRTNLVLRPRDAADVYAHPRPEMARLVKTGAARNVATGYYLLVPGRHLGDDTWRPDLHAVGLGIGRADYGQDGAALMGVGAARQFGAVPREIAVTFVAVPKQRPPLETEFGKVVFVRRDVAGLDLERIETEVTPGWVTTPEQTLLDLAARPALGGLPAEAITEALRALWLRADTDLLAELAAGQRKTAALQRARHLIEGDPDAGPE
ncbi:type IV toxin-antitoxin system AbiEi family antitoxin [Streptomyces sp. NPDC046925]|uniref:type IV toxin-antitoxin system AbiEi family antitoxin domain-containing protein n=1 Tax=Streptomyces sp. NPDC046925 TaxID=3155375 RepID=UPI0033D309BE